MDDLNGRNVRSGNVRMRMQGQGHRPLSEFAIEVRSTPRTVASGITDANGTYDVEITLPADLEMGPHSIVTMGTDPMGNPIQVVSSFLVTEDGTIASLMSVPVDNTGDALPATGSNTTKLLVWSNLMILCGAGIVVLARRELGLRHTQSE
jgi:LPXTG-motif cell wall-anchored protein